LKINDVTYGKFEIKEKVIKELIDSKPVQRLKGICQYGVPDEFYSFKNYSRYEHSVGVMLLLRKLNASLEEQIAGLLHDVSHTAFSHVIDWVVGTADKEDFQDRNHQRFVLNTEIPKILLKNGLNADEIVNFKNFSLLEREIPNVCADRVDYSLKDYMTDKAVIKPCVENMTNHDNKIVFSNKESALMFALNFLKCQSEHWGDAERNLRWYFFADAMKMALKNNIIVMDDFYKDDSYVVKKLISSKNKEIKGLLNMLRGKLDFKFVDKNPEILLKKKFRYVDPEYLENGKLYRLSDTNENFKNFLHLQKAENNLGLKINLLK